MDKLREMGYEPEEICESGIVATISGPKPGKTFLLRADMDALPMEEATACEFSAKNGNMHSCGHDMHSAMLLGAAKLLKQNQDQIEGTVKLVFQPDEEGFTGAKKMIEAGVLQNPKVDAAIPTLIAFCIPKLSIVAPYAAEEPCPPSIEIVPHIIPSKGFMPINFDIITAIVF